MNSANFDLFGWYDTSGKYFDRIADKLPETIPVKAVEGQPYPNWTGREWVMLSYIKPPAPPEPQPVTEDPRIWWIDVGPFYDRFGPDALAIAASDNGACKAVQTLTGVRKYIDLKDPKVSQMIDMLIALQQPVAQLWVPGSGPMTEAKKLAILTSPTTEQERHIKGL